MFREKRQPVSAKIHKTFQVRTASDAREISDLDAFVYPGQQAARKVSGAVDLARVVRAVSPDGEIIEEIRNTHQESGRPLTHNQVNRQMNLNSRRLLRKYDPVDGQPYHLSHHTDFASLAKMRSRRHPGMDRIFVPVQEVPIYFMVARSLMRPTVDSQPQEVPTENKYRIFIDTTHSIVAELGPEIVPLFGMGQGDAERPGWKPFQEMLDDQLKNFREGYAHEEHLKPLYQAAQLAIDDCLSY